MQGAFQGRQVLPSRHHEHGYMLTPRRNPIIPAKHAVRAAIAVGAVRVVAVYIDALLADHEV
jgi:hypothetical protein